MKWIQLPLRHSCPTNAICLKKSLNLSFLLLNDKVREQDDLNRNQLLLRFVAEIIRSTLIVKPVVLRNLCK